MTTIFYIIAAVVAVLLIGTIVGLIMYNRMLSKRLKSEFGPEYDRTVEAMGSKNKAQRELEARDKHMKSIELRPLTVAQHDQYSAEWRDVQASFVDNPRNAVSGADRLIMEVMQLRGYPLEDFDQRAADLSVQYPELVGHYRDAQAITMKGDADTEMLRQAMLDYRSIFKELLKVEPLAKPVEQISQQEMPGMKK